MVCKGPTDNKQLVLGITAVNCLSAGVKLNCQTPNGDVPLMCDIGVLPHT